MSLSDAARPPRPLVTLGWEYVDPETAKAYYALNFDRNRRSKPAWVARLAEMMRAGHFYPTHQGIAFDRQGRLVDGQNRLLAIIQSGVGCWLAVARGVEREHVVGVDKGAVRVDHDQIRIAHGLDLDRREVAIAKLMWQARPGCANETPDLDTLAEFVTRHREAIDFANQATGGPYRGGAPLRSVVARAWYHEDPDRLAEFVRVVDTGEAAGAADFAAIRLRDELMGGSKQLARTGANIRQRVVRLTLTALAAFLRGRPLKVLRESHEDPFTLPEDEERA